MKAWKDKKGCFSSVYPERQPFLMPDGLASRSSREERYVAAQPYAHAVLPSGAAPIRASLCPAAERCSLVLSKNVGTYEPSFGSLCTVTFLAKRKRVLANSIPPAASRAEGHAPGRAPEPGGLNCYVRWIAAYRLTGRKSFVILYK